MRTSASSEPGAIDTAHPTHSLLLEEDSLHPLDWITAVSLSPSGSWFLLVQGMSGAASVYTTATGSIRHTIRLTVDLSDSVAQHQFLTPSGTSLLPARLVAPELREKLNREIHNGYARDDSTIILATTIEVFDGDPLTGPRRKLKIATIVEMDTSGRVRSVTPTDYPNIHQFQNGDAFAVSARTHTFFLDHEYWQAYQRGDYDSSLMVASFDSAGHDKRMMSPTPEPLRRSALVYGPGRMMFAMDSSGTLRIAYACLPDIFDESGAPTIRLRLPNDNTDFIEALHQRVDSSVVDASSIWSQEKYNIMCLQTVARDSLFVATWLIRNRRPWRFDCLLQLYDDRGNVGYEAVLPDDGSLGKPEFAGVTRAGVPYVICNTGEHYTLHFLSWKSS